jgi:hypothetical protein
MEKPGALRSPSLAYREPYRHWPELARNVLVANDPKRTFDASTKQKAPNDAGAFYLQSVSIRTGGESCSRIFTSRDMLLGIRQ